MEKELDESAKAGNSDESNATDPNKGQSKAEDKFGGDYEKLKTSYTELERKLSKDSEEVKERLASLEEELEETRSRASVADKAAEAYAAKAGISVEEAMKRIERESEELHSQYAPKITEQKENKKLMELEAKIEKRDLLDEFPEAKSVVDLVADVAKAKGKSMREVYESRFKATVEATIAPKDKSQSNTSMRSSFRDTEDEIPDDVAKERSLRKQLSEAKNPEQYKATVHEINKLIFQKQLTGRK